jgi:uncharacterized protein (DUF362 family)
MDISRREFIRKMTGIGFTIAASSTLLSWIGCAPKNSQSETATSTPTSQPEPLTPTTPTPSNPTGTYLAVARGQSPRAMTQAVIQALGGIEHYVKPNQDVIIKPNICVSYHSYEYAATTNPEVVGTLVSLCKGAGAKRVRVMDQPFGGTAEEAYARTGIGQAVQAAGGQMEIMSPLKFVDTALPGGIDLKKWPIYSDVLKADVFINVPIAKHHNLARLTLGMKNLMGVIENRSQIHFNIGQRVADLATLIKPTITVVDCVRILKNNGPTGGDLGDVQLANTVIASQDIVAADSYATTLFGLTGEDIPYIRTAAKMGLGILDLKSLKIEEINV